MPFHLSEQMINDLDDDYSLPHTDDFHSTNDDDELCADQYRELSKRGKDMNARMNEAERMMTACDGVKPVSNESFVPEPRVTGDARSSTEWKAELMQLKHSELLRRKAQASKPPKDRTDLPTNHEVDSVKIIPDLGAYLKRTYKPQQKKDRRAIKELVKRFSLNKEQARAFRIIANHASDPFKDQLRMYLGGMAGTGKSQVIKALSTFFHEREEDYRLLCVAPTGSAAALINGSTYHSVLNISYDQDDISISALADVQSNLKDVNYMFLDEISMVGCHALFNMCKRMCTGRKSDLPFGGINVIFAGDFAQLAPVIEYPLYSNEVGSRVVTTASATGQEASIGKALWHQFTTVVILRENMRQRSQTEDDAKFRTCLENMRYQSCTPEDIALLRKRIAGKTNGISLADPNFRNVSIITRYNAYRDKINDIGSERIAQETRQQLEDFHSIDRWTSKTESRKSKHVQNPSRDTNLISKPIQTLLWELPHNCTDSHAGKLSLCVGMPVMIKRNIATECAVTNGAEGTVVGWKSKAIDSRHNALDIVFVKLLNPPRKVQLPGLEENVVPIAPVSITITAKYPNGENVKISRTQCPIIPNFAMTDFNSQGRTRLYNVCDLQNCSSGQSMYTCLSRSSSYQGTCIIQNFDADRIINGISGFLRQEFRELEILDEITRLRYEGHLPLDIEAETRGLLIFKYRKWKGVDFVPKRVPSALKWSKSDGFELETPEEETHWSDWYANQSKEKEYTSKKRGKKSAKSARTMVTAAGTQALANVNNGKEVYATIQKKRKLEFESEYEGTKKIRSDTNSSTHGDISSRAGPKGVVWNSDTYSCAYDSMCMLLYKLYEESSLVTRQLVASSNPYIQTLFKDCLQIENGTISLENARDYLQAALHNNKPSLFPLYSKKGTDIMALCCEIFSGNILQCEQKTTCLDCQNVIHSIVRPQHIIHLSKERWERSVSKTHTYKSMSISSWLKHAMKLSTEDTCPICHGSSVLYWNLNNRPYFLPISQDPDITIKWDQYIQFQDQPYRLCGLIYYGKAHFTTRIVSKDGSIWYHDGIRTGALTNYEGNISNVTARQLKGAPGGRKCSLALYIKSD